jgi:hypothetical protein
MVLNWIGSGIGIANFLILSGKVFFEYSLVNILCVHTVRNKDM